MSRGPAEAVTADGAVRFARYAYPPNALGYCGTPAHTELLERVGAVDVDPAATDGGLTRLARGFDGAWPYLELLAAETGRAPLDDDVVTAYWIGNDLLDRVTTAALGRSMEDRFARRAGPQWRHLSAAVPSGGVPHHSFHVFCVYPWVGLLRSGIVDQALEVLDRCRVRAGRVLATDGATAQVRSRPLTWDGRTIGTGAPRDEVATLAVDGRALTRVAPGDVVALHWDWVCDVLTGDDQRRLERVTAHHVRLANATLTPRFAAALDEAPDSAAEGGVLGG